MADEQRGETATETVVVPEGEAVRTTTKPASLGRDAWRRMRRNPLFFAAAACVAIIVLMALVPQVFAGWFGNGDPRLCALRDSAMPPTTGHPFGFDVQGCDLYANVIYGARTSLAVGLLATLLTFLLAVVLGSLAGYAGRWADAAISRLGDIFFGFPFVLGAIVILTVFNDRSIPIVAGVLTLFAWPSATRLMRATVLSGKGADYVVAAKALGASHGWIIRRHVLPNAITPVVVYSSLSVGGFIAAEAALTYLGVGLEYPSISWGLQLASAEARFTQSPHLLVFPGLFLSITIISFVLLGDIARDAFDPKANQ